MAGFPELGYHEIEMYAQVLGQFLFSLLVQMGLWRLIRKPGDVIPHQILWLFVLFLGIPIVQSAFSGSGDQLILALGLGSAYIMSFPAASAQSPTILMIDFLSKHDGLAEKDLEKKLNERVNLVGDRLRDLEADGLASKGSTGPGGATAFRPSGAGYFLGLVFWTYRKALGLPPGGG